MIYRLLGYAMLFLALGTLYVLSPFWAAWSLNEAIKKGDTAFVERKVDWVNVRATLKRSINGQPGVLPQAVALGARVKPTLWQRVKSAFGQTMVDRFLETYVTPTGLSQLAKYRATWRAVAGEKARPWTERIVRFYKRIRRAEMTGLTRVEFEIVDKYVKDRSYAGVFVLRGLEWQLRELRVISERPVVAKHVPGVKS